MPTRIKTAKAKPRKGRHGPRTPAAKTRMIEACARLVSVEELSQTVGVSRVTLYQMTRKGLLPHYRIGKHKFGLRFVVAEVLAALRQPAIRNTNQSEMTKG